MIERTNLNGITLRAEALACGIFRIQAGGFDGYQESLLERYGLVNALETATDTRETRASLSFADGMTVTLEDGPLFTLTRGDDVLLAPLPSTKVATAPTLHRNQGFQLDLPLVEGEKFIGFGDHQRKQFLLNGLKDSLWIQYPVKHVPVPFFMSSRGYGIFFNTTRRLHFDVGVTNAGIAKFAVQDALLDIFVVTGESYEDMIRQYCLLTGFPGLPPLKSFGLWLILHTRANGHDVLMVAKNLRHEGIPCDNLSLEPDWMEQRYDFSVNKEWSAEKFRGTPHGSSYRAGPNGMIRALKRMGFELGLWLCCRHDFTWEEERRLAENRPEEGEPLCLDGIEISHPDDNVAHGPVYMDTATPRDQAWFEHLKRFVDDGARFFKVDPAVLINEFPDRLYGNGRHDEEMHNIAFLLCSKEMCLDFEAHTGKRSYGIAVAGWAGLQRFPGTWAGDTGGGAQPMVGILQDAIVAHPFATCDMNTSDAAGLHMGFLLPWSLINSWAAFHYPGFQGDEIDGIYRDYSRLRMSLLHYFYSLAYRATQTGKAIACPLCLIWPDVDEAYEVGGQYMLGDSLLVSVYQKHIVLPDGKWFDYWRNEVVEGYWDRQELPIPENRGGHLLVREGGIVPTITPMQHVHETEVTSITWQIFPGPEPTEFTLYLDTGDGLDYRSGAYACVTLRCEPTDGGLRLSWSDVEGGEPERITRLEHRFEVLGHPGIVSATADGTSLDVVPVPAQNRAAIGIVRTGRTLDVKF